jgi:uncharacterized membrane protein YebE (DUF533 family)
MIGFFEHQFLSYKKNHIKNLLSLAKADGFVHDKEKAVLMKIGRRYGLKDRQIIQLMESDEKFNLNVPDNHKDKMNLLYDLMLMVFADGVVDKNETAFVEDVVKQFGMKKEIVKWLIEEVFDKELYPTSEEWLEVTQLAAERFTKKKEAN